MVASENQMSLPADDTENLLWENGVDSDGVGNYEHLSAEQANVLKEELKKTEDEIDTLKKVLRARQNHAAELRKQLGISPLEEISRDIGKKIQNVRESGTYQKGSEVAAATADTVRNTWNSVWSSSMFKTVENKFGAAVTGAKAAANLSKLPFP